MKILPRTKLPDVTQVLGRFEDETFDTDELIFLKKQGRMEGKFCQLATSGVRPDRLYVGLGKRAEMTHERLRKVVSVSHKALMKLKVKEYRTNLHTVLDDAVETVAEAMFLSNYTFEQFKAEGKPSTIKSVYIETNDKKALARARVKAESTCYARDLINMPPNILYPAYMVKEAKKLQGGKVKVTVFDKAALKKGKFGGILAVGLGSARDPAFVIVDYNPGKGKTVAFVGKGVTFDSGGVNVKPGSYMESMKCDMSGAAAALSIVKAASELKIPHRVIAALPLVENMPSATAYRPDDIVRMYSGKTVEMINTDAEGRMILADALAYTEKTYSPDVMVDFATLTGACVVALGYYHSGLMTNDETLATDLLAAGKSCGDTLWRLPLGEEYKDRMKSDIADVRNCGKGRDAGTVTAGIFLSHFVKSVPWAHIDIAGTAFLPEAQGYKPKNGTGAGVRLAIEYLQQL
jgi:leucyl aminopeptidase